MNELIEQLVQQLGVKEEQAKGGTGLLLKLAQEKLGNDFGKISQALPETQDLIKSAPEPGGAAKMLGGLASAFGGGKAGGLADLASLAGSFGQLKLDPSMISRFIPLLISFVQNKGGPEVASLLASVLRR